MTCKNKSSKKVEHVQLTNFQCGSQTESQSLQQEQENNEDDPDQEEANEEEQDAGP